MELVVASSLATQRKHIAGQNKWNEKAYKYKVTKKAPNPKAWEEKQISVALLNSLTQSKLLGFLPGQLSLCPFLIEDPLEPVKASFFPKTHCIDIKNSNEALQKV